MEKYQSTRECAKELDAQFPSETRKLFHIPLAKEVSEGRITDGMVSLLITSICLCLETKEALYFCGNSLGIVFIVFNLKLRASFGRSQLFLLISSILQLFPYLLENGTLSLSFPFSNPFLISSILQLFPYLFHSPTLSLSLLGLQPRSLAPLLQGELAKWQQLGVMGHFKGAYPWVAIDDVVLEGLMQLVGSEKDEVSGVRGRKNLDEISLVVIDLFVRFLLEPILCLTFVNTFF
jgi:hypothetical protein